MIADNSPNSFEGEVILSNFLSVDSSYENVLSLPQSPSQTLKEQEATRLEVLLTSAGWKNGNGKSVGEHIKGTLKFYAKAVPASMVDSTDAFEEAHKKRLSLKVKSARKKRHFFVVDDMKLLLLSSEDTVNPIRYDGCKYRLVIRLSHHSLSATISTHRLT